MLQTSRERLRRLGVGESIDAVCKALGWSRKDFDAWWLQEAARRAPPYDGEVVGTIRAPVTIQRDRWGIPHIFAEGQDDLWYGFGYAMAQDRLFQLDYLRRRGLGRLAEVLGTDGVAPDLLARTVGLNRIVKAELARLPDEVHSLVERFSAGVNAWIERCGDRLPIEFDLLDYRPEPWSPLDCLAIENEFRWYLTGRFPVIVMPELAKRVLSDGPLFREFLLGEADEEPIVPPEAYADKKRELADCPCEEVGQATGDPEGTGSNNWVVAGRHSRSGLPMVASDPHIAMEAVSCWYQAHLHGGGFNVAGMTYVGIPAIMFGRNERVAWGITNNICSLRDLYQERTDPEHPNCFLFDDHWEPQRELVELIGVKGGETLTRTIRFSRHGPIVDEILPPPGNSTGPVSLKWLGAFHGGWLTALVSMDRARSVREFREALRPWHVPTFNLVIADVEGGIAVQCAGRIPLRKIPERGYRPGWEPEHEWCGLLPFEAMPHAVNPSRGWLASANNRLVANDYPHSLSGTWVSGYRAMRIGQMIEAQVAKASQEGSQGIAFDDFRQMQHDTKSLRAAACLPPLLAALSPMTDVRVQEAVTHLRSWDGRVEADLVAPTLFNVFFTFWSKAVVDVYFDGMTAELLAKQAEGIASRLLAADRQGWFPAGQREPTLRRVFTRTLEYLSQRLGPIMADWRWGRLHLLPLKHVLSARGDLGQLLDQGGVPVKGDMSTVCNTGSGPEWLATTGAGYRFIADLSERGLWAVDAPSQSGHPGTPHYSDQLHAWTTGEYHFLPLNREDVSKIAVNQLVVRPSAGDRRA